MSQCPSGTAQVTREKINFKKFTGMSPGSSFSIGEEWKPIGDDIKIQGGKVTSTRLAQQL